MAVPGVGDVVAGRYEVECVLGEGAQGVVVAARNVNLREQRVAIKFLLDKTRRRPDLIARFLREGKLAAMLSSTHIAKIHDVGTLATGEPFLVMEYLEGSDLGAVVKKEGPLGIETAVGYVLQVCEALAEAHALGIVHRDLKPANLFLTRRMDDSPVIKVIDFGIAKRPHDGSEPGPGTASAAVMGTPQYMAPEQMRSTKDVDARADLWAVGVILHKLITGEAPFPARDLVDVYDLILEGAPPLRSRLPHVPAGLEAAVLRCLQKDPTARYPDVGELATALAEFGPPEGRIAAERARGTLRVQTRVRLHSSSGADVPREEPAVELSSSDLISLTDPGDAPTKPERGAQTVPSVSVSWEDAAGSRAAPRPPVVEKIRDPAPPSDEPRRAIDPPPRSRRLSLSCQLAVAVALLGTACVFLVVKPWLPPKRPPEPAAGALASFSALPSAPARKDSEERIALGRALFSDPRLSHSGDVSCATCHALDRYGVDGKRLSRGSDGREPPRNTLSIYNVSGFFALLWDGRQDNLVEQAKEVLLSPRTMAATRERLPETLRAIPSYTSAFATAFPGEREPVSFDNTARALAAFEGTLFTRGRWDRFLEGDRSALSDDEKAGFNRFVQVGCITCHFGPNVGATMFQKTGLYHPWPDTRDQGRYEITKLDVDRMVFRVPSLRNVAVTAPYFHDGSVAELPTAIRMMGYHQLGKELDDEDVASIASWLGCLTGDLGAPGAP